MATDALSYTGINRAYSDFAGSRACEELINLRPTTEGVVPVKEALVKMEDVPFRRLFVHYTTDGPKYIAVWRDDEAVKVSWVADDGEVEQDLFNTPFDGDATIESIHYASAGNILLISMCDRLNEVFKNSAFTWKEGGYADTEATAPDVSFEVSDEVGVARTNIPGLNGSTGKDEVASAVESGLNAIQESNPDLCLGPILIALAFKTSDGKTFRTGNWTIYDPAPSVNSDDRFYLDSSSGWFLNQMYNDIGYYDKYDHAYSLAPLTDNGSQGGYEVGAFDTVTVPGTKVTLTFPAVTGWDEETSVIRSLEVYASRPQVFLDAANAADGFIFIGATAQASLIVPAKKVSDMDLGGQLLYLQASIPMASLAKEDQTVTLSFGGNVQMTEETLEADAGAVERFGRILSYNARFHFYGSVSRTKVGMPHFSYATRAGTTPDKPDIFVRYADGDSSGLVYLGQYPEYLPVGQHGAYAVIAPSIAIKEVIEYFEISGLYLTRTYRMTPSSTYNYAICTDGEDIDPVPSEDPVDELEAAKQSTDDIITNDEPDAINVTEQYNPFVFLVQHSYKAPGNVIDVQPQMAGITDSSYGRDPLSVFTERGIYALTQGSANVLYGAFLPVSNSVISSAGGGALPTEMGIFFLADGALWLLAGRRSTLVSDALHLGPHPYIRTCPGYQKISGGGSATPEYDVSNLVSSVSFEVYVRSGGRLGFNRFRMELLVSNKAYPYTYVLSLKYRQWFKIGRCVWQDDISGTLVSTPGAEGTITVLDLSTETDGDVLVHMQTRPFSMGYRYIHMHRIVAMVRARLSRTAGEKLVAGLYGSDDLQDWKLLAYAKRPGASGSDPLKVSQLRTTSAARSWRYYTVCVGGVVPTDTDLGPIVVDYEPVIRRIG